MILKSHCYAEVIPLEIDKKTLLQPLSSFVIGFAICAMGKCFVAESAYGICIIEFVDDDETMVQSRFKENWPSVVVERNDLMAQSVINRFFGLEDGLPIRICLSGTAFQRRVWRALLDVPAGTTVSYGEVARMVGNPGAVRAAATAVASNRVGLLVPCHRIIRNTGALGQFAWGTARKAALLEWERSHAAANRH